MSHLPYLVAVWLFVVGLYGIVTSRHLVHLINCLAVCQSATYVLLVSIGYRTGATAPVRDGRTPVDLPMVDPVVQALTLTDIVVGAVISALLLAIAVQSQKRFGTLDPDRLVALRG